MQKKRQVYDGPRLTKVTAAILSVYQCSLGKNNFGKKSRSENNSCPKMIFGQTYSEKA